MTPSEFKLMFTEFSTQLDARVQIALDQALEELGYRWDAVPTRKERAQGLLAAHILFGDTRGSSTPGGPVTGDKVGDLSRNYGSSGAVYNSNFGNTYYGQEFVRLMKGTVLSMTVT